MAHPRTWLATAWTWLHGELEESPVVDRSPRMLWVLGAAFAFMTFVHVELEVRGAPLVRGFWRGGAFLGGSLATVVMWWLWDKRRSATTLATGLLGTALVVLPTAVRVAPALSLKASPVPWLVAGWAGCALLWWTGRRAGVRWAEFGLSLGDWRWWLPRTAVVGALIVAGTVLALSSSAQLREFYPWQRIARTDLGMYRQVQAAVFVDFLGWEYMHRGLLLFLLARRGDVRLAIWAQAIVFLLLHTGKPPIELLLSLPGGVVAGYFAWRSRSFVPLWFLHAVQLSTTNAVATWLRGGF